MHRSNLSSDGKISSPRKIFRRERVRRKILENQRDATHSRDPLTLVPRRWCIDNGPASIRVKNGRQMEFSRPERSSFRNGRHDDAAARRDTSELLEYSLCRPPLSLCPCSAANKGKGSADGRMRDEGNDRAFSPGIRRGTYENHFYESLPRRPPPTIQFARGSFHLLRLISGLTLLQRTARENWRIYTSLLPIAEDKG